MNAGTVVLATGGTGGHMFPAQALAGELQDRGYRVAVVTDARGMRHASFARDVAVHAVSAASVAGRGAIAQVGAVASLFRGMFQASRLLGELRPCVVVGFGGYPSIPAVAASIRRGIRTVVHEQNAVLGRANRLVARGVQAIGTSFEHTAAFPAAAAGKVTVVGNPVRPAIAAVREIAYRAPSPDGSFELLVVGGSQGATVMSKVVPTAIASLDGGAASRVRVVQQCRPEDMDDVRRIYRDAGIDARVATFVDDLPDRLATAHLVISRAGASTVSEIAVAGRPAILVPYPHASDDHQTANARVLSATGAAWLVPDSEFSTQRLVGLLREWIADPAPLVETARRVRALGRPDAPRRLADLACPAKGNGKSHDAEGSMPVGTQREKAA
jgi:UDP-N-acetylglucosamine--N-acetylmuramyl-(pentapeptide) pyrophosphoryl-undecaprenol N-acetylglucosamine transferase